MILKPYQITVSRIFRENNQKCITSGAQDTKETFKLIENKLTTKW